MRFKLQPTILILIQHSLRQNSVSRSKLGIAKFSTHTPPASTWKHGLDPHKYTSGRWLKNDKQEQALRFINFDFDALCEKMIKLSGASSITNCEKIEGGSNRVLSFMFDNDKRLVAKLPFKVAGPPQLTTASEVATVKYLQKKTDIPIPKILDWSSDAENHIGSEYIVMEHATGTSVWEKWSSMTIMQRVRFIDSVYKHLKTIPKLKFHAYGSIYFDSEHMDPSFSIKALEDGFCIGPHCGRPDLLAYSNATIDKGLAKLPATDPDPTTLERPLPFYQGSVETHIKLLEHARILLAKMSEDIKVKYRALPTLFHPDLHKRNIFVSDEDLTVITAFIDWQSASIEPAFWYADKTPDFVSQTPSTAVEIGPADTKTEEPRPSQCDPETHSQNETVTEIKEDKSRSQSNTEIETEEKKNTTMASEHEYYTRIFDTCLTFYIPQIGIPHAMQQNIFRPFYIPGSTWEEGSIKLQHELIQLTKEWKWLGLDGECPYPAPSTEDQIVHSSRYEVYKDIQQIIPVLTDALGVSSDSWGYPEHWGLREETHKGLYIDFLNAVENGADENSDDIIRNEEDVKSVWPFDIPVESRDSKVGL
ncbi:hypothetical protein N7456_009130 [Penicillium angulare]|uniref:Altered inheritance of mitochondria protein 9, mitochondrial n=1 Tax=Penicillium angulare TaxID=116970 RepID=A0A9W9K4Z7_9EURO|nr:hypothetical protein N7456_009130 [Penicillium angulare]